MGLLAVWWVLTGDAQCGRTEEGVWSVFGVEKGARWSGGEICIRSERLITPVELTDKPPASLGLD